MEFRFLCVLIVLLELFLFVCGFRVVGNRHEARRLFIEIEREQQITHSLNDERARLVLEISEMSQLRNVEEKAAQRGFSSVEANGTLILDGKDPEEAGQKSQAGSITPPSKGAPAAPKKRGAL